MQQSITDRDRKKAEFCLSRCPICTKAREKQKGFRFWFVKNIEDSMCPACKAYAKVHGRKAHEPIP